MRPDLKRTQQQRNLDTLDADEQFEAHRQIVMRLIEASASELTQGEQSMCQAVALLGVGNGNDIDLSALASRFDKIHLVDVDDSAVMRLVTDHPQIADSLWPHSPVDVAWPLLSLTSRDFRESADDADDNSVKVLQSLSNEEVETDIENASCDVVVSLCLLSQLVGSLGEIIGDQHPALGNAIKAIRMGHLRRMLNLLRPGGIGVLISDVVSSDTAPEIESTAEAELDELVRKLVDSGNFFSGTNPAQILADLNILERLSGGPETAQVFDPWIWNPGPRRYAVTAIRFQKKRPVMADSDN